MYSRMRSCLVRNPFSAISYAREDLAIEWLWIANSNPKAARTARLGFKLLIVDIGFSGMNCSITATSLRPYSLFCSAAQSARKIFSASSHHPMLQELNL
jgi:hypothetical protein